jgi:hypothetical protein
MSCKHTFSYTPDPSNPHDLASVEVASSAVQLEKVIQAMEAYLLACGYVFPDNCHLGYEEDEGVRLDGQDRV